ncbi:MAG: inorganic phosphate transporter [Planctomycetota bacterium]|nr:inorganic phosphate transporter [Planctomycetota bacterium]MDA1140669.1 inorganic phosphate transporter [Planctomycetota bacterium]
MTALILLAGTCFLAYTNGANDNFKGVATLFGSRTTSYSLALWLATVATFLGSVCSVLLAKQMVLSFSGKGLVPDSIAGSASFLMSVATGAGLTVLLATITGFPISTTHSLTGALVGAGLVAGGSELQLSALGKSFVLPLLVSPLVALGLAAILYMIFRSVRLRLGVTKEMCVCVGESRKLVPVAQLSANTAEAVAEGRFSALVASEAECIERYSGHLWGVNTQTVLDALHFVSAGLVSFARGLNDTPKIAAILLAVSALRIEWGLLAVGAGMSAGGLLSARKVARTMSERISPLNHGQGFTANVVTAFLVIVASRFGMPVSTTHVSCGSLFGIGLTTGEGDKKVMVHILLSWLLTLPCAAFAAAVAAWLLGNRL